MKVVIRYVPFELARMETRERLVGVRELQSVLGLGRIGRCDKVWTVVPRHEFRRPAWLASLVVPTLIASGEHDLVSNTKMVIGRSPLVGVVCLSRFGRE